MALLKDVRLLLIIGLAILCLIALKMCSTAYVDESLAVNGADSKNGVAAVEKISATVGENETSESADSITDTSTADTSTNSTQTATTTEQVEVVADKAVQEATAVVANQEPEEPKAEVVAAVTQAAPSATEATPTAAVEASTASASDSATITASPVAQGAMESVVVEKINLRKKADTGSFFTDFKTDISSVENGMYQYRTKVERAQGLMDKIKSPGQ